MIKIYTEEKKARRWIDKYRARTPVFATILGFTETCLRPGISAAGKTPEHRKFTAVADAEYLIEGAKPNPTYPLPPLTEGASPVLISRAVIESLAIPVYLFNAGLPVLPSVPSINLNGKTARCVSSGEALPLEIVESLFEQGLSWGKKLAQENDYIIIGECVVGGTTTALAILTGLGFNANNKVNSSHPQCNHQQKWALVETGLKKAHLYPVVRHINPFQLVAAVGDTMQIVAAAMAIGASRQAGVMLAGGTQMLAVYALARAIANYAKLEINLEEIVVGTTRWVAEDRTGDTIGLAKNIAEVSLLATQLNFSQSPYRVLKVYEEGFVKEGVGAGGLAIAATLAQNWDNQQFLDKIHQLIR
jgi:uncharacterized protein (TIGR00303 family)